MKEEQKQSHPYKYKSLKVYSSSEWMFQSTKKYRKVFDKSEVTYLRFHFAFYNKEFDEKDWSAKVSIISTKTENGQRKEICTLKNDITVSKLKNVINVYESWGVDNPGGFWKAGDYTCEAYIDGEFVSSQNFHIYDIGKVLPGENPYFEVVGLKLYEGKGAGVLKSKREYLKVFDSTKTHYVWSEITIKPKTNTKFQFEYFTNYFDEAGHPKATTENFELIPNGSKGKVLSFVRGWGNEQPGSWKSSGYSIEIIFMEHLVIGGIISFSAKKKLGDIEVFKGSRFKGERFIPPTQAPEVKADETLQDIVARLDELIGLKEIKQNIKDHISYLDFLKLRKEKGIVENQEISLHSVFTGNPGTGKTTVVKLLGKIYQKKGLLSKGHVHEVDRAHLVGEFIGQTAPKVKKAIKEARGGILFVDEAYMLVRTRDDNKDFGKEVIEVLVKEMSDGPGDIAIMMAGYPKETMYMVESNPGLKSRVKYFFHFNDYTPDELIDIAVYAQNQKKVTMTPAAKKELKQMLTNAYRKRDHTFGNARFAFSLVDEAKMNMGLRIMNKGNIKKLTKAGVSKIKLEDVKKIAGEDTFTSLNLTVDQELLNESLSELDQMVDMNAIKQQIYELIKLVKYYKETGINVLNKFSLHSVFTGNPGTGKTTIARIFGKVYKALGLLERGHITETGKEGLVAGYVGQTALKAEEMIKKAMGGVLFIDEAYALAGKGGHNSFGHEAIEVILKNMEDYRGKFAVIAAGYPDNMEQFLKMNPGLKSRFDRTLNFEDYSADTLYEILEYMLAQEKLYPDEEAQKYLKYYISNLHKKRDKYFGNARSMRKIAEQAVKKQNLRMADMSAQLRTKQVQKTLTKADIEKIDAVEDIQKASGIGFA
ncbi:MAG: AAA family ATPase [Bacteroidota bacterium]|nr:AAA family ATPase [Bacteroidota bacterium]